MKGAWPVSGPAPFMRFKIPEPRMQVDLSHLEGRVDASTPESARRTLREAAEGALAVADELRGQARVWLNKGRAAANSIHTEHLASGFYRRQAAAEADADAVRATAYAWLDQASRITDSGPLTAAPTPPAWVEKLPDTLPAARRTPIARGGQGGRKEKITLPDGTKIFHKTFAPHEKDSLRIADAEELSALVGAAIGAPVPHVHRADTGLGLDLYAEWVDGAALINARRRPNGNARAEAMLDSPDAQRLGLLDLLSINHDRHENNLRATPDDKLRGIDNGLAWNGARWILEEPRSAKSRVLGFMQGPAERHYTSSYQVFGPNPLTPGDVAELRRRLSALRPAFDRRGRGEWLDVSLVVVDLLEPHAAGTRPLLIEPRS